MSRFGRLKRSARITPGAAICCDCGFNTMPSGKPKPGTFEQFIVKDDVWIAAGMTPGKVDPKTYELLGGGFLCVGCIEARLGRRLTINDLKPIVVSIAISDVWSTERLRSRMLYATQAEEDAAKLADPIKWTAEFGSDGLVMTTKLKIEMPETWSYAAP